MDFGIYAEQISAFIGSLMNPEFIAVMAVTFIFCDGLFKLPRMKDLDSGYKQVCATLAGGLGGLLIAIPSTVPSWIAGAIAGYVTTRIVKKVS